MSPILRVLSTPVFYALELTPLCNHRCPGCGNVFIADKNARRPVSIKDKPLRFSEWKTIIDIIAPHAQSIRLTGGEPTLHPDFEAIVQYIQKLDLRFAAFTNGHWQDSAHTLSVLTSIPQLSNLLVSLHGADAETHDAFTGVSGSFEQVTNNIRRATEAGIPVATNTVLTHTNKNDLAAIAQLAQSLGARRAVFGRYLGPPLAGLSLSKQEAIHATRTIDRLRNAGESVQFGICIPQCLVPGNHSTGCYAGVAYCTIDPWGNVRPCNHADLKAGNLRERPLQEIWHGDLMTRFRQTIAEPCRDCPAFSTCHGGCRAMILEMGSDPLICPERAPPPSPALPTLRLHPDWHPQLQATIRRESWGLVLIHNNHMVPVTHKANALLDALDGTHTLQEIKKRFGDQALNLIGLLAYKHMVALIP